MREREDSQPDVFVVHEDAAKSDALCQSLVARGFSSRRYGSAEEFFESYNLNQPGCVITTFHLPGMNGLDFQKALLAKEMQIPLIMLISSSRTEVTVAAIKNGAVTVLETPCSEDELCSAVRQALVRDADIRSRQGHLNLARNRIARLTRREQEVLRLVVEGVPNKVIAARLGISLRTVEYRRHRIFEKTNTSSLADLVRLEFVAGMRVDAAERPDPSMLRLLSPVKDAV